MKFFLSTFILLMLNVAVAHSQKLENGDVIYLKCLGTVEGSRWLNGGTEGKGAVSLSHETNGAFTGTKWQVFVKADHVISIRCLGTGVDGSGCDGNRWLDGHTGDGSVGLAPSCAEQFSGTHWFYTYKNNVITLKCLGKVEGKRWLNGGTQNGSVSLAPSTQKELSGTRWEAIVFRR